MSIVTFFDQNKIKGLLNEDLLWDAKVFTINMIASGNNYLDPKQVIILYLYTFIPEFVIMINNGILEDNLGIWQVYIKYIYESLDLLPNFNREVFIGTDNVLNRNLYKIGNEITWPTFMSGTSLWRIAVENVKEFTDKKRGTIFIVKSKTGKFIGQYSRFIYDSEIMFKPNSKFKVIAFYRGDVLCLGQANIRQHTFGVKAEDMEKMLNSNNALIIELEEL